MARCLRVRARRAQAACSSFGAMGRVVRYAKMSWNTRPDSLRKQAQDKIQQQAREALAPATVEGRVNQVAWQHVTGCGQFLSARTGNCSVTIRIWQASSRAGGSPARVSAPLGRAPGQQ